MLFARWQLYLTQFINPDGWTLGEPGRTAVVAAMIVWDFGIFTAMRRTGQGYYRLRLPVDLALMAGWAASMPPGRPYNTAALLLLPLAIEAAALSNYLMLATVTVGGVALASLARMAGGLPPDPLDPAFFLAVFSLIGLGVYAIFQRTVEQEWDRFLDEQDASLSFARLQARNEVLLGAGGSAAEALHRAWFLLEAALGDRARERRWAFQASREELTAQTRERARYLVDVLQQFSAAQRRTRAAVADHLHLRARDVDAMAVLTSAQARSLVDQLARLQLTGEHAVDVAYADPLTGEVRAHVGPHALHVPGALGRELPFVPLSIVVASVSILSMASPTYSAVPVGPVLAVALGIGVVAGSAWWRLRRRPRVMALIVWATGMVAIPVAVWVTWHTSLRWVLPDGTLQVPALGAFTAALAITGGTWRFLARPVRWLSVPLVVIAYVRYASSNPIGQPRVRQIVFDLSIPLAVMLGMILYDRMTLGVGQQLFDRWVARLRASSAQAYTDAVAAEVAALRQEVADAAALVADVTDRQVRSAAGAALAESGALLQQLEAHQSPP